jgi:stage II sporulation protein GA (sporulation sigma-E factor processing peptidase)
MTGYIHRVVILNLLIHFLLLMGASRLYGYPARIGRCLAGAILGAVHVAGCLLPGFYFLRNILWRIVGLGLMAGITYGLSKSAFRMGVLFSLLAFALGGAVSVMDNGGMGGLLAAAGVLSAMCCFGFRGKIDGATYIPVELEYQKKHLRLTALRDTGNTLRDPITGGEVLVISADAAGELTGLTRQQLQTPVESIGALPGLRLIPYRSVGKNGFLLAMRLQDVKIGQWRGSSLVAFAPARLSTEGAYQALTGGAV